MSSGSSGSSGINPDILKALQHPTFGASLTNWVAYYTINSNTPPYGSCELQKHQPDKTLKNILPLNTEKYTPFKLSIKTPFTLNIIDYNYVVQPYDILYLISNEITNILNTSEKAYYTTIGPGIQIPTQMPSQTIFNESKNIKF